MMFLNYDDLVDLLRERFGRDPLDWAFVCPTCGDIATGRDFHEALTAHPLTRKDGTQVTASHLLGRECIGRSLGALDVGQGEWDQLRESGAVRGCDRVAYGLFRGPAFIVGAGGDTIPCFEPALAVAR